MNEPTRNEKNTEQDRHKTCRPHDASKRETNCHKKTVNVLSVLRSGNWNQWLANLSLDLKQYIWQVAAFSLAKSHALLPF